MNPKTPDEVRHGEEQLQFKYRIHEVLSRKNLQPLPPNSTNWTGEKLGKVEVIAYSHSRWRKKHGWYDYWIIKCDCGEYEMRRHDKLRRMSKSPGSDINACTVCVRNSLIHSPVQPH